MIRTSIVAAAIAAVLSSSAPAADSWATAESAPATELAAYHQQLLQLESEVEMLRTQIDAAPVDCGTCSQPSSIDCSAACDAERCGEWEATAELLTFWPHTTNNQISDFAVFQDLGFDPAWRLAIGYTTPRNIGVRARYWDFDHRSTQAVNDFFYELNTAVLDVEATNGFAVGRQWEFLLSAGARYVNFEEVRGSVGGAVTNHIDTEKVGLVIGAEARRDLIGRLDGYMLTRGAAVFGDSDELDNNNFLRNNFSTMWECQFGLEHSLPTGFGRLVLRGGFEAQAFNSFSTTFAGAPDTLAADSDVGFVGFVTGLTLLR